MHLQHAESALQPLFKDFGGNLDLSKLSGRTEKANSVPRGGTNGPRPHNVSSMSMFEVLTALKGYSSVVNRKDSIAFNLGQPLTSTVLCEQLSRLFSVAIPDVVEGPQVSWANVVLCRGPFPEWSDESTTLKVDGSVVKLAKSDLSLLRSGRPRRFLSPWPDGKDCETELRSVNVALAEIHKLKELSIAILETAQTVEQPLLSREQTLSGLGNKTALPAPSELLADCVQPETPERRTTKSNIICRPQDSSQLGSVSTLSDQCRIPSIQSISQATGTSAAWMY